MKILVLLSGLIVAAGVAEDAPKKAPAPPTTAAARKPEPEPFKSKADLTAFLDTKPSKEDLIRRVGAPTQQTKKPEVLTFDVLYKRLDPVRRFEWLMATGVECHISEGRLTRWEFVGIKRNVRSGGDETTR